MKMGKLDGKVAVITGSNKGIGKGIARAFVKNGASVVLAARNEDDLNKTREELSSLVNPEHILSVPTDVTDESQDENLFAGSIEQFGRLDILVNNAGAFDGCSQLQCSNVGVVRRTDVKRSVSWRANRLGNSCMDI